MIYIDLFTGMIELYSKKSLVARSCSIFDKSVLYTASPNKVVFFPPFLNVSFTKHLHFLIIEVLHLQAKYVQSHSSLIWLIRCKYWPQRFVLSSVIVCACVLYCMCTTAFALVTISHQRPCQSVLGLCICYPSRLDTRALSLSWLDYTLLYLLYSRNNSLKTFLS